MGGRSEEGGEDASQAFGLPGGASESEAHSRELSEVSVWATQWCGTDAGAWQELGPLRAVAQVRGHDGQAIMVCASVSQNREERGKTCPWPQRSWITPDHTSLVRKPPLGF